MFEVVLSPIVNAVKAWMSERTYQAARQGAADGLRRFASEFQEFAQGVEALPEARPQAVPLTMAAAAQVTPAPAEVEMVAKAKELIASGMSQRAAAEQVGMAESTLRGKLKS